MLTYAQSSLIWEIRMSGSGGGIEPPSDNNIVSVGVGCPGDSCDNQAATLFEIPNISIEVIILVIATYLLTKKKKR